MRAFALVPLFFLGALPACTGLTAPPSPEAIASEVPSSTATAPKAQAAAAQPPPPASSAPAQPLRNPNDKVTIKDVAPGAGPAAKDGDTVSVLYTGKLEDGTVFDSSAKNKNQPLTFTLGKGGVIDGWQQGILGMKKGGKRKLSIPPSLAYGQGGIPGKIPPNATLNFDVELKSIGASGKK